MVARFEPDAKDTLADVGGDALDDTFGDGGTSVISPCDDVEALTEGADAITRPEEGYDVAIQGDGAIVAVGIGPDCLAFGAEGDDDFLIARLLTTGTLDPTFGDLSILPPFGRLGYTHTDFLVPADGSREGARGVTIDANGDIVVAGTLEPASDDWDFALARYHATEDAQLDTYAGQLDQSFDGDGRVETDFAGQDDGALDVAMAGNAIVAVGFAGVDFGGQRRPTSFPDTTFNATDFGSPRTDPMGASTPRSIWPGGSRPISTVTMTPPTRWPSRRTADRSAAGETRTPFEIESPRPLAVGGSSFALIRLLAAAPGGGGGGGGGGGVKLTVFLRGTGTGKVTSAPGGSPVRRTARRFIRLGPTFSSSRRPVRDRPSSVGAAPASGAPAEAPADAVRRLGPRGVRCPGARLGRGSLAGEDRGRSEPGGRAITYHLTVSNAGPGAASSVTLTDPLPAQVEFVSADPSRGVCTPTGGTVVCDLGDLEVGASATVDIVVRAHWGGAVTNTALVSLAQNDPTPDDDSASATTTVETVCTIDGTAGSTISTGRRGSTSSAGWEETT